MGMADVIAELLVTEPGIEKRGARAISADEARQLPRNRFVTVQNPRGGADAKRRLLVGRTDGGRTLTLVIEQTLDPGTWLIVTGWTASGRERRILDG